MQTIMQGLWTPGLRQVIFCDEIAWTTQNNPKRKVLEFEAIELQLEYLHLVLAVNRKAHEGCV